MAYWWPRIAAAGVSTPRTVMVHANCDLTPLLDGMPPDPFWEWERFLYELQVAAASITEGGPWFLRTAYGSGKHEWIKTCLLPKPDLDHPAPDRDTLAQHVFNLVEWSHTVDMWGLPHDVWAVREMIPNVPLFYCHAYGGMPVVPEWRLFVRDAEVTHVQPYWPLGALEQGQPSARNWREIMAAIYDKLPPTAASEMLGPLARQAVAACGGGYWSVDFLWAATGSQRWWLTDMAAGELSYRYDPATGAEL